MDYLISHAVTWTAKTNRDFLAIPSNVGRAMNLISASPNWSKFTSKQSTKEKQLVLVVETNIESTIRHTNGSWRRTQPVHSQGIAKATTIHSSGIRIEIWTWKATIFEHFGLKIGEGKHGVSCYEFSEWQGEGDKESSLGIVCFHLVGVGLFNDVFIRELWATTSHWHTSKPSWPPIHKVFDQRKSHFYI